MNKLTIICFLAAASTLHLRAQDWPQWRGPNRDAHAPDFKAPQTWPKELTQKWKVTVGEGASTPALSGDRLYVFSREGGNEVIRCLAVADGKEIWQDKYESFGASGAAQAFSGPRSSPAVGQGKVVTIGVRGMISTLDAAKGTKLWRKDEFKDYPQFHPASSPLIQDGMVIAQLGGRNNGAVVAYDLATGDEKWKWSGPSPAYASPALITVDGNKLILAQTESKLVALQAKDGTAVWESSEGAAGGGPGGRGGRGGSRDYHASSPVVDGQTVYLAGRGVKAIKLQKEGDKLVAKELWNNPGKAVQFNTPTLKDAKLYALATDNELFCLSATDGKVLWNAAFPSAPAGGAGLGIDPDHLPRSAQTVFGQAAPREGGQPGGPGGPPGGPGRRGGMGGRGMGGGTGFGSLVDAGPVVFALTPGGRLLAMDPAAPELKVVASYKVSDGQTYAYPVVSGNRIFIKDKDSVALWTVE